MDRRLRIAVILLLLLCVSGCLAAPGTRDSTLLSPTERPVASPAPVASPERNAFASSDPSGAEEDAVDVMAPAASSPSPRATSAPDYTALATVYADATLLESPDGPELCLIPQGRTLAAAAAENGFVPVRCEEGEGVLPEQAVVFLGEQKDEAEGLVNVRLRDASILCSLMFCSEENFTGRKLYDADVCMLEENAFEKLEAAQQVFLNDGYSIKIFDAYRPHPVQYILYEIVQDSEYIADPDRGSRHNRGLAVDMTLVNLYSGQELEMPASVHTFGGAGRRDAEDMTEDARLNLDYMTRVMEEAGFSSIHSEWWHFQDLTAQREHPLLESPLSSFLVGKQ